MEEKKDRDIFYQTFTHHWAACRDRIHDFEPLSDRVQDDILTVTAQLEQMLQLLQLEMGASSEAGGDSADSILDMILSDSDNILAQIVSWTKSVPYTLSDPLILLQLQFFETLLSCTRDGQTVLSHVKVLHPLLSLLELVNVLPPGHNPSNTLQTTLLGLVHTLCLLLMESSPLLDLFTCNDNPRFILFSLLTPYLHKRGQLGQQARDSLLLCISLASRSPAVETYIAEHSNFLPILASGLSGLFSALPRSLGADSPSWHRLDPGDAQDIPGLSAMLTSVELCSAVVELAPSQVASQLLDLVHQGFIVPVLGPALIQKTDTSAVVSSTAYVDLFLRHITAPALRATLVRFLLCEQVEGKKVKDVLVERIGLSSQICIVTLSLFETLISLHIEDVMLSLVFSYLLSCSFLLPSFRQHLRTSDPHGRAAYKFLALVPVSCDPPITPLTPRRRPSQCPQTPQPTRRSPLHSPSPSQSYSAYLADARSVIRTTAQECRGWRYQYDGTDVREMAKSEPGRDRCGPPGYIELSVDPQESEALAADNSAVGPGSLGGESSGYLSGSWSEETTQMEEVVLTPEEERDFWTAVGYSLDPSPARHKMSQVLARVRHEDRLSMSSHGSEELSPRPPQNPQAQMHEGGEEPSLGPFLTALMDKVATMPQHTLGTNLRLTGLVSKLATFPHPLLKAVLLHPDVVVQPTCLTLAQAIGTARLRIDSVMPGLMGAEEAVRMAKEELSARIDPPHRNASNTSLISLPASLSDINIRRSSSRLLNMFSKKNPPPVSPPRSLVSPLTMPPHTRQMASTAVLIEEWLQELAALAQEHSVLQQEETLLSQ